VAYPCHILDAPDGLFGTIYQKRFGSGIDWRPGMLIQYAAAGILFALGAMASRRGSCSALQDRVGLLAQASERDAQLARGDLMGLSVDTLVHAEQFLGLDGEGQLTAPAAVRDSSHGRPNRKCSQRSNVCSTCWSWTRSP